MLVFGGGGVSTHVTDWSLRVRKAAERHRVRLEIADRPDQLGDLRAADGLTTWEVDYEDVDACVALARERAAERAEPLVGVVAFREKAVESAATAAAAVGVAWNPPEAVRTARRKHLCREFLRGSGFRQPECLAFDAAGDAVRFLTSRPGRWVVKPSRAFGSEGVSLVSTASEAERAVSSALTHGPPVLVEEFVEGEEFSAEGVFVRGTPRVIALTQKGITAPPYFVELEHVVPAPLPPATRERVIEEVERALLAIGLRHSIFHVEFWVTSDGEVVLGEVHARPGGDWIHLLVHASCGVDLFGAAIADLLEGTGDVETEEASGAAAVVAVLSGDEGTVERVEGADEARADERCLLVDVLAKPGAKVNGTITSSFDRMALVAARGPDPAGALASARSLASRIRVTVT